MKLSLNKKKIKALSADKQTVPAVMTPQVAGGALRFSQDRLTHCMANTCGRHTCPDIY
ncbi:hypothetical protein [Pseudoalteromonas sp. S2755]|uniref:hypothetical protein n=1 Tax=Pseudoalteromonas sp. S2755 TaxID=2066523 RepID=UPI001486327F|nr:hypothetical protein [Pseudoalteromonas sp. S2755]